MSLHNAQEPMDPGDLEHKHRVFLCHSGAQEGFVEQLHKDLRSVDRYPFFSKDRECLPIGDNFPSLIFQVIELCQVGVVFLSEEFFVRSPWPMFEVVKLVECGRRIMPILLGISSGDLANNEKGAEWKSKWEVWARSNRRIDVARWESTLRSLRPLNWLVFNGVDEVKFWKKVLKEVCKIVGSFHVHNAQRLMDPGDLERKYRVYLSHSAAQMGFVEQLHKDLRRVDRYAFFTKDRECLPIGAHFPSLIVQAIQHCQVGVVFLSEEFFVQAWSMIELVELVKCGKRIMPIFLGISPGDLSNEEKVAKWKSKWEVWARSRERMDVASWESTLRSLRPLIGLVYNDVVGEVKFREEIVKEVCKLVGSFHEWDDSHVQGRSRISKLIQVKISETQMSKKGVRIVGLYGVGGIGKTTACKSLCNDLLEFDGRVCHIEFRDDTSEIDRVQEVLKWLTNIDREFIRGGSLEECWSLVKDVLRLSKVVLEIDNVWDNSKIHEEVQKYLRLEYGQGSIVMVTARALGELEKLGIERRYCLEMPMLVEEEARALFAYYAEPKDEVDAGDFMKYVNRCSFGKGDGEGPKHYYPLALRVLGSQMFGKSPSEWKSQLRWEDVFKNEEEEINSLLAIVASQSIELCDISMVGLQPDVLNVALGAAFGVPDRISKLVNEASLLTLAPNGPSFGIMQDVPGKMSLEQLDGPTKICSSYFVAFPEDHEVRLRARSYLKDAESAHSFLKLSGSKPVGPTSSNAMVDLVGTFELLMVLGSRLRALWKVAAELIGSKLQ